MNEFDTNFLFFNELDKHYSHHNTELRFILVI